MFSQAVSIVLGVHACFLPFLWCFKSAPFCPSTSVTVSSFINVCNQFAASRRVEPSQLRIIDLGSGSGTVLFAAAKQVCRFILNTCLTPRRRDIVASDMKEILGLLLGAGQRSKLKDSLLLSRFIDSLYIQQTCLM